MKDTSGFYKKISNTEWWYAPNAVHAPSYTLQRDGNRESVDGWEWHDEAPAEYIVWEYEQNNINDNGNTI
jgi:hypothetical protein